MSKRHFPFISALMVSALMVLSASAATADSVSFNYQGRVKVQNQPFNGSGLLKFAILNTSASAVLWSNDGTVGAMVGNDLPAPSSAVASEITDGIFSVQVGDASIPGMAALDSAVMVSDTPLRLRVWFSNGELGFQELKPDHKLIDLTLNKIQTGTEDFNVYVNGATGNDANNGLTFETAKKTIAGAVDILPDKIRCNITVIIAPGTYREIVTPHGLSVAYGKTLLFTGDTSWTPSAGGAPSVVIDGADLGDTPVREYAFHAHQCTGVVIQGITFQNTKGVGANLENGSYVVNRCLARQNDASAKLGTGNGFGAGPQSEVRYNECAGIDNQNLGFAVHSSSRVYLTTCTATQNYTGVGCYANSITQLFGYNNLSNNTVGAQANGLSDVSVWPGTSPANRTRIENNSQNGVVVNWGGQFTPADAIISGTASQKFLRYYGTIIGVDPQPPLSY